MFRDLRRVLHTTLEEATMEYVNASAGAANLIHSCRLHGVRHKLQPDGTEAFTVELTLHACLQALPPAHADATA